MTKRVTSVLLALLMIFSLSGCKNNVQAYRQKLNAIAMEVSDMDEKVSEAVTAVQTAIQNADKAAYETAMEELEGYSKTLKEKYNAIANEAAPSEYAEDQKLMQQYEEDLAKMLDNSMELYQLAFDAAVNGDMSAEAAERVQELQTELVELVESVNKFDEVLTRIMGGEENSGN